MAVSAAQAVMALRWQPRAGIVVTLVAILVGLGAVYGGFHYGIDVVSGAALGLFVGVATLIAGVRSAARGERILIIRLAAIGDVVMASSLARRLRDDKPDAQITWLCGQTVAPLVERFADVDEVIAIDDRRLLAGGSIDRFQVLLPLWRQLRAARFDTGVLAASRPQISRSHDASPRRSGDRAVTNRRRSRDQPDSRTVPRRRGGTPRGWSRESWPDRWPFSARTTQTFGVESRAEADRASR